MRKQIVLAAVAALGVLVCSCEKEKDITITPVEKDAVSLVLGGVSTRSAEDLQMAERYSFALEEEIVEGMKFSLEETLVEMGGLAPVAETRGTPAYTENVVDLYTDFNGVIYGENGVVATDGKFHQLTDVTAKPWRRGLGFDPWEKAGGPVTFFVRMPGNAGGVTNLAYDYADNSIDFDYATPAKAEDQKDILFGSRNIDKDTYVREHETKGGAQVLFQHALTGVKFAIGNNSTEAGNRRPDGEVQTFITKVVITGLKDKGHAKFVYNGTEHTNTGAHVSASSFTWTPGNSTATFTSSYGENDIVDFVSGDDVNAGASFYEGGTENNLNKPDASKTFWFIPQTVTDDLVVTVTLKVWNGIAGNMGEEQTLVLEMGKMLKTSTTNAEWKAGQLRTFTLKPNVVDVDIDDDVDGFKKTNVVITNTGNVDAYIRANIVANWWGKTRTGDDGVALGYLGNADNTAPLSPLTFVDPWELDYDTLKDNYNGEFQELPGDDWVRADDGFFYYKNVVKPGKETGSKLFKEYELNTENGGIIPKIMYLSTTGGYLPFTNIRLVMDLTVQAVDATGMADYKAAWAAAGVTVTE